MDSRPEAHDLASPSPTAMSTSTAHALASSRIDNLGMGSWPARRARVRPDAIAWEFEGRETTYLEVHERTDRLASALRTAGVTAGDRVAYVGFNHPALLEVFFACGMLGATAVLVNPRLSAPEVEFILGDSGAELCFYGDAQVGNVEELLAGSDAVGVRQWIHVDHAAEGVPSVDHEGFVASGSTGWEHVEVPMDSVALIMYTSGTTGRPKGAMLTHQGLFYQYVNALIGQDLRQDEVYLTTAPLFHIAGLNMMAIPTFTLGGKLVIQRAFKADVVLRTVADRGVTSAFFVPAMLDALSHDAGWAAADLSSLRQVMVGGSPLSDSTITTWSQRDVPLLQGFGMTETAPGARMLESRDNQVKLGSAGRPHFFTDSRVVTLEGDLAAPGEAGEILISGPNVMAGYWNRPEATEAALEDGWYHSGDVGVSDEDGFLFIRDRLKDMYISGGENVYPAEVENALHALHGVRDCAVIGVPDERWGETGLAFVELLPDVTTTGEELREQLRERLAAYKLPQQIRVVEEIPRTATGKIQKFHLRDLAVGEPRP